MDKYSEGSYLITKFFPICDCVYLHKELPETVELQSIDYFKGRFLLSYKDASSGIEIDFEKACSRVVKRIKFSRGACMPGEWVRFGLTWDISYYELWLLMARMGLVNIAFEAPRREFVDGKSKFVGSFVSAAPDGSFSILFRFDYSRDTSDIFDKNTLYRITVE